MSHDQVIYGVTIEGIGNSTGQVIYCYPEVPLGATADYVAGLAEPPRGCSAEWDILNNRTSVGRYTLTFLPGVGPVDWGIVCPVPVTKLRGTHLAADTTLDIEQTNAQAGIAVDDILYLDRETVQVTVAVGGATTFTCTRGYAGSEAVIYDYEGGYGPCVYRVPPALTGRLVTITEMPRNLDIGDPGFYPTTVIHGYIYSEVVSGLHFWSVEIVDRFSQGRINKTPIQIPAPPTAIQGNGEGLVPYYTGPTVFPVGCESGGYWLFPNDSVYRYSYDAVNNYWYPEHLFVGSPWEPGGDLDSEDRQTYLLLYSDLNRGEGGDGYVPFGYYVGGNWIPSDNPAVIALNLLLSSQAGDNYLVGDAIRYDKGPTATAAGGLWPQFAMGVPRALVDVERFESEYNGKLAGIHANRLWLGGRDEETIDSVLYRLFAPLGYTCGAGRDGVWRLFSWHDVYPYNGLFGDVTHEIDHVVDPPSIEHQTLGRALDQITMHLEIDPCGHATDTWIVSEEDGRRWYSETVGQEVEIQRVPYSLDQVGSESLSRLTINQFRRLARRLPLLTLTLGPEDFDQVDLGDPVEITELAIRDPEVGGRLGTGGSICGLVVALNGIDYYRRQCRCTLALATRRHIGLISPSALITAWTDGTHDLTVDSDEYSGDVDTDTFLADDMVVICNSHLVRRSKLGDLAVASIPAANTIRLSRHPRDDGDVDITPVAGDILVYDDYDYVKTRQLIYVFAASGGAAGTAQDLGDDHEPPYLYGD